jgi:hypothetical protein
MNFQHWTTGIAIVAATLAGLDTTAHADLEKCGGVFLSADASCEYLPHEECMTECTTAKVETACVAKLYQECEVDCTATASTTCESACATTCTDDCAADAGTEPNCMGACRSDCAMGCTDKCADAERRGPCQSCCAHNCNARCQDECGEQRDDEADERECEPKCTTACAGSCTAQANLNCQIDCQTTVYTECEEELVKTCETTCKDDGGAIFCDGQFLSTTDLDGCVDEIAADLSIEIKVTAEVACDGDSCEAKSTVEKAGSALGCSVSDGGAGGSGPGASMFGLGLALLVFRRRASRKAQA